MPVILIGLAYGAVGGIVALICSLLNEDSTEQTIKNVMESFLIGMIVAWFPNFGMVYAAVQIGNAAIDCIYYDYSFEEGVLYVGLSVLAEKGLPEIGVMEIDFTLDSVYGSAKTILCEICQIEVENHKVSRKSNGAVSAAIYSVLSTGSLGAGCMGMTTICFGYIGGQSLCYRL